MDPHLNVTRIDKLTIGMLGDLGQPCLKAIGGETSYLTLFAKHVACEFKHKHAGNTQWKLAKDGWTLKHESSVWITPKGSLCIIVWVAGTLCPNFIACYIWCGTWGSTGILDITAPGTMSMRMVSSKSKLLLHTVLGSLTELLSGFLQRSTLTTYVSDLVLDYVRARRKM